MRYHLIPVRMAIIKKKRNNMLVRMWKKGNPCTLIMGTWTGAATMENSIEVLHDPVISFPSIYPKKTKPLIWKDVFTIAKIWKQPMSITRWKDKEDVAHMYNSILFRHKKRRKSCHFWQHSRSMGGSRGYFAKWNVRQKKTNTIWSHLCMKSKKKKKKKKAKQNQAHSKSSCDYQKSEFDKGKIKGRWSKCTTLQCNYNMRL